MAAPTEDIVYALHDFEAENEDELSFAMGSKIVILERDDQYGDGWFQGRNEAGEVGLFPQSYTSVSPPSPDNGSAPPSGRQTPEPVIAANMNEVQQALASLQVQRAGSLRSGLTGDSDDDEDETRQVDPNGAAGAGGAKELGAGHRATLAAIAAQNAENAAREEREREDQRRKDDEAAYEKARQEGLVEGLQLSDESDEEAEMPLPVGMTSTLPTGVGATEAATTSPPTTTTELPSSAIDAAATSPPIEARSAPLERSTSAKDIEASSIYAESTYSEASAVVNGGEDDAVPTAVTSNDQLETITVEPPTDAEDTSLPATQLSPASSPKPAVGPRRSASSFADTTATPKVDSTHMFAAAGAGAAGIAAAGVALHHATSSFPHNGQMVQAVNAVPSLTSGTSITAVPAAPRTLTPEPSAPQVYATPKTAPLTAASLASQTGYVPSPVQSVGSVSSRLASDGLIGPTNGAAQSVGQLPYDPRTWGVEEVCEWASAKGFDALTLTKFREHEISGDVLIEMDVAMLKEIDLVAFGRRVHIYNAIKELKARITPAAKSSLPAEVLSPAMSGYEPDTPSTMGFASPTTYHAPSFGMASQRTSNTDLHGLGLDPSDPNRRPSSVRTSSDGPSRQHSRSQLGESQSSSMSSGMVAGVVGAGLGAGAFVAASSHRRSMTGDTARESIGADSFIAASIPEEVEDSSAPSGKGSTPATPVIHEPNSIRTTKSSARPKTAPATRRVSESETSAPPSPNLNGSARKKDSGDRTFFGTLGRSRKPPPKMSVSESTTSMGGVSSDGGSATARPGSSRARSALNQAKRSTRLFGSFGGQGGASSDRSSSERVGSLDMSSSSARKRSNSTLGVPNRDGPSSMSPKAVEQATSEMIPAEAAPVEPGANLLEKIGTPDYSGWMQKKGDKYNTWKQRFFVIKGVHLYYLKSESEQRVKGVINLKGYRVISDPTIHAGQYGFKIVHDVERAHFFSASEQYTIRNWMREIMKATIGRNYDDLVVSSCDIETMPLTVAQTMYPPPRPPSPTERARVQKERYGDANPNTLTPADAQKLMEFTSGSPLMTNSLGRRPSTMGSTTGGGGRLSLGNIIPGTGPGSFLTPGAAATLSTTFPPPPTSATAATRAAPPTMTEADVLGSAPDAEKAALLAWVNANLPSSAPLAIDLGTSLSSGQTLVRLVESLSGKKSDISDADFAKYKPMQSGQTMDVDYFDTVFNVFDYLSPIVSTDEISMSDLLSGNEPRLMLLVSRIKDVFDP